MPSGTSNRFPDPPSLEDIYTSNIAGGMSAVFGEWDRQFKLWDTQCNFISDQEAPAQGGGGQQALKTPAEVQVEKGTKPEIRLGWAKMLITVGGRGTLFHEAFGWPITMTYGPTASNTGAFGFEVDAYYQVPPVDSPVVSGHIDVRGWPIPDVYKARVDPFIDPGETRYAILLNPVLRVTLIPVTTAPDGYIQRANRVKLNPAKGRYGNAGTVSQNHFRYSLAGTPTFVEPGGNLEKHPPIPLAIVYAELM